MTTRHLWHVITPDGDTLTVIAEGPGEAFAAAIEFCDDDEDNVDRYGAVVAPEDGLRWVGFESDDDALEQAADLVSAGVDHGRIQRRTTTDIHGRPLMWEVGARDADWCLLPAGVLCGGAE